MTSDLCTSLVGAWWVKINDKIGEYWYHDGYVWFQNKTNKFVNKKLGLGEKIWGQLGYSKQD
jgi:hypothetical protein